MGDSLSVVPSALISTRTSCPLCNSPARVEIDSLIYARHKQQTIRYADDVLEQVEADDGESKSILVKPLPPADFAETQREIGDLLEKLPIPIQLEYSLTDLIVHTTQHEIVLNLDGVQLRSEGALLFANEQVYRKIDPVDFIDFTLALLLEDIKKGRVKLNATYAINAINTRWRMTGNAGGDEFVAAMIEHVKRGVMEDSSPLGKSLREREQKLKDQALLQNDADDRNN